MDLAIQAGHGSASDIQIARDKAYATLLEDFDVGNPELFRANTFWPYFERLRRGIRSTTAATACSGRTGQ